MKKLAAPLIAAATIGVGLFIWKLFDDYEKTLINKTYNTAQVGLIANTASLSSALNRKVALLRGFAAYVENNEETGPSMPGTGSCSTGSSG
ncbi:hypothetical protein O9H85_21445 [Paenibacillus filicis]|uniref:Chemotaxis methyl-accepting receptor HlyB-like 4HB MCP domain-containing protein n=1 Tax=Paenibacillus gyeongsangnamensis TaxID=3388067 RepID=A0ABT4QDL6_9BACL|nr:hypothetical protein [Paenibacillus filicis]MCZ8514940.1 hypothetical protein [Paenibacillus filicis]